MTRRPMLRPRPGDDVLLPYGRQTIEDDDIAAVVEVLRGDWLTTGPTVRAFEEQLAAKVGAAHAVSCANATAGLHIAAAALGLGPGSRAIVPTLTFAATANAVRYTGAEVLFSDVDPDTGLIGPAQLRDALARAAADGGPPVKAVLPVHLNGQCVAMEEISAIAADHELGIIIDAAHAIGASYQADDLWWPVGGGRHAAMTVFSFHPVKTICMGEGGAVTTDDPALARKLLRLRNHGINRDAGGFENADQAFDSDGAPNPWYYEIAETGYNYRVTDMQCALGLSQLRKLDRFVARRAEITALYDRKLSGFHPAIGRLAMAADSRPAWHLYVALIDFAALGVDRATLIRGLSSAGIATMVHYVPVHLHPVYRHGAGDTAFPGAMAYYNRALSMPLFPAMADQDVDRVLTGLKRILEID